MNKIKNFFKMWLIPLLLIIIMTDCEERRGITSPTISTPYTVTLSSTPSAGGTTSGSGTFNSGSSVTVTATPNSGYTFTNWTENGIFVTSSISYQFTIRGNRTLAANFTTVAPTQYTVTLLSIPSVGGITSGGGAFNSGSSVTLTATPNSGYTFTNWTENGTAVSTNTSYTFTISGNRTLVANFTTGSSTQYTITLSSTPSAGGTTSGSGTFDSGTLVTVTATPNTGYTFTNWTENGVVVTSSISYQFTISGNKTLVANFTVVSPTQYTVTLLSIPSVGGTTSGSGAFNSGASVTVIATANSGYTFTNWTENGTAVSTNASYTFTISGNRTLVANFTAGVPTQYTVTLSSTPSTGGTTSGGGTFNSGSSVTVTATPNSGYTFTNWTENGIVVTSSISYQFTISGNRTLVANFTTVVPIQYTVTLLAIPAAGGNTSGGGAFNSGSSVTVTATPNTGYTFTNWTENGTAVSTNANYTFTISGNRTLVANFATAGSGSQAGVNLGSSARFAALSASAITNIPTSSITGDLGIHAGARSSITGFVLTPDASNTFSTSPEVTGKVFASDDAAPTPAMLIAAKADALAAYLDATAAVRGTPTPISGNLNGLTLVPGLYESGTSIQISPGGFLYLDAQGNNNAVFIIRSATSITTEATSEVVLTNGAQAANVYWAAGSAVTLGTNSKMKGTIIASTSISLLTGARLDGRTLIQGAAAGQISLDHSTIVRP